MQKLIKLSDTRYMVVDDSEIKEGDFVYYKGVNKSLNPPKNGIYKDAGNTPNLKALGNIFDKQSEEYYSETYSNEF